MIDIENVVYTKVREAVLNDFPNAFVSCGYQDKLSAFPAVVVSEIENTTYRKSRDNCLGEHHASVTYQLDFFVNNKSGAKTLAKKIASVADEAMLNMKFDRTMFSNTPNIDDTIYRITARYIGVVSEPIINENGDMTYIMYRR